VSNEDSLFSYSLFTIRKIHTTLSMKREGGDGIMRTVYETERLLLKVLDKTYASLVLDYFLRNKAFLEKWEILRDSEFYTKEYQERQLDNDLNEIEKGSLMKLWIFKKEDKSTIIGSIAFSNIIRGPFLSCFLGYRLDKDQVNKGYMTEAIRKGISIVFNDLKLHRIEANIMPKNKQSLRVVEKLGFYNEGLAYKYLKINGKWEDHIHMVLLNDEI